MVRDLEHPFAEDLTIDEAGVVDPLLPILTKVSSLVDALKMGGSCELIEKLWVQFVLSAGPVNYPEFCRAWLVGLRLKIFTALNSRSVVWPCGPSCERG